MGGGGRVKEMNLINRVFLSSLRLMQIAMQFLVFLVSLIFLSHLSLFAEQTHMGTYLYLTVFPVLLLYIARFFVRNGFVLFLLHILIFPILLKIGNTAGMPWSYGAMSLIWVIGSISFRTKHTRDERISEILVVVFIATALFGNFTKSDMMIKTGLYTGVAFILLQILYYNFINFNYFIETNRSLTTLPVHQMLTVNFFIMGIVILVCTGSAFLFGHPAIEKMVLSAGRGLKYGISFLLRFLFRGNREQINSPLPEKIMAEKPMEMLPIAANDSIWTDILNGIGIGIGVIAGIGIIIFLFIKLYTTFINLIRNMNAAQNEQDEKEFILAKEFREFRIKRKKNSEKDKSLNKKVRNLYKTIVTKNASKQGGRIKATMMPHEISNLYIHGEVDIATSIYEKARYGREEMTKEDVERLKTIGKNKAANRPKDLPGV